MPAEEVQDVQVDETSQDLPEAEATEAEQEPEPAADGAEVEGESDGEPSGETDGEVQDSGTDDDWLPDEQKKEFPLEELVRFAEKRNYGFSAEQIASNPGIQKMLKDKLNADFTIRSLKQQYESQEEEEQDDLSSFLAEDGLEVADEEPQQAAPASAVAPAVPDQRAAYYQRVESLVQRFDKAAAEEMGRGLLSSMGVNADPKFIEQVQASVRKDQDTLRAGIGTPEQRNQIQQRLDANQQYLETVGGASKIGQTLAKGATDLMLTMLPEILPEVIEQVFPGSQQRHLRAVTADSWEELSQTTGRDQKPLYPNLPRFGSPEYKKLVLKVEKGMGLPQGGLGSLLFRDTAGQPLSPEAQIKATLKLIARATTGQRMSPKAVSQALQTGAQKEREQAQRRAQGRALGSGQPTSAHVPTSGNEDIFGPGMAEYKRRGG